MRINTILESGTRGLSSIKYEIMDRINDEKIPMYGEFGNISSFNTQLSNVSHIVKNASVNGTNGDESLYADVILLDTPQGNIIKDLMEDNGDIDFTTTPFNISARYSGNVKNASAMGAVVTISKLLTYDIVPDTEEQIRQKRLEARKRKISSILKGE
jgi:hypothetical protein